MSTPPDADGRDEESFRRAFADHYGAIVAYGVRRLGDRASADDLAAEVFVVAWRRFTQAPENLLPWLYGIAGGVLRNQRRGERRRMRLLARLRDTLLVDGAAEVAGERDAVISALAALRPADQEILRLVAWEGLDHAAAAVVLGCTPGAAKVRLHRARRRLAARLSAGDSTIPVLRYLPGEPSEETP
ncbi:MAG TPA: sigma-70 family RNA polymerase sigma factor [Mycobacteriales bacterium]|nr:sigma-70 family RNA polymerase sigma factor [Mycobacteriales bacterium]